MPTPLNATWIGTPTYVAGATGFGQAASIDTTRYLTFADLLYQLVAGGNGDFTLEWWQTINGGAFNIIMGHTNGKVIFFDGVGHLQTNLVGGSTVTGTNATIGNNARHHISLNVDNTNSVTKIYVDGVLDVTMSGKWNPPDGYQTWFGWSGGQSVVMVLDEIDTYAGVLRTGNFTPPTAPVSNSASGLLHTIHFDGNANDSVALPLAAAVVRGSTDQLSVKLSCTATGGIAPYSYQWHRSTSAGFTPSNATALAGATASTLSDITALPGVISVYKCVVTDSASATVTTTDMAAARQALPGVVVIAGGCSIYASDLISDGKTVVDRIEDNLRGALGDRQVVVVNKAVSGTTAGGWRTDTNYTTQMINAANAAIAANPTFKVIVIWHHGENDAWQNATAATFISDMNTIIDRIAQGVIGSPVQIVNCPGYRTDINYPACANLCVDYRAALPGLIKANVRIGDWGYWQNWMANHPDQTDLCHPTTQLAVLTKAAIDTLPILQELGVYGLNAATIAQLNSQVPQKLLVLQKAA